MTEQTQKPSLIDLIEQAGQAELEAIEVRIAQLQTEINERKARIAQLEAAKRIITAAERREEKVQKCAAMRERKKRKADAEAGQQPDGDAADKHTQPVTDTPQQALPMNRPGFPTKTELAMFDMLSEQGPLPIKTIADKLKRPVDEIKLTADRCGWFASGGGAIRIAKVSDADDGNGNGLPSSTLPDPVELRIRDLIKRKGSMPVPAIAEQLKLKPLNVSRLVDTSTLLVAKLGEVHLADANGK